MEITSFLSSQNSPASHELIRIIQASGGSYLFAHSHTENREASGYRCMIREVPKKQLPANIVPKAGMTMYAQTKDGQRIPARIKEVKKDVVVMDFNHPLAGKTLNFDIEVVQVK